jgi:penicillin V acylase-like amidase (Ntn superfamily)
MPRTTRALTIAVATWSVLLPASLQPCTNFCCKHDREWIFAANYDWDIEYGLITTNKRRVSKVAFVQQDASGRPAQWTSKYGSVTFNQYGRELPLSGMNETGLVVGVMWLSQTEYPRADRRPILQDLQWVQYQLDTAATVEEVISSDREIRIDEKNSQPIHFLVCDRNGGAAAIEFLNGRMRAHAGKGFMIRVLTNNTYEHCLRLWALCGGDEAHPSCKRAGNSLQRFIRAGNGIKARTVERSGNPVSQAFRILDTVSVERTMFRVVYDTKAGRIHFRTKSRPRIRTIDVSRFDFSCGTPARILDVLADLKGNVTDDFREYTASANYHLIKKSFAGTSFLSQVPESALRMLADYPDTLSCKE